MNNIMLLMEEIELGYLDKNNEYHYLIDDDYHLLSPEEINIKKVVRARSLNLFCSI